MTMTSFSFFLLCAVLLLFYYLLPYKCQSFLLLLASFVFCWSTGGKRMFFFLAVSVCSTWSAALLLEKAETEKRKTIILGLTLALNLGILFVFKYLNFFVYTGRAAGNIFGVDIPLKDISLVAPMGLSFYTLQVVGYLLDVSRGTCRAEKGLLRYALFAGFFPQLVQGPINRYSDLAETLYLPNEYSCAGVPLFRRNGYRQSSGRKPLIRNRDTTLN